MAFIIHDSLRQMLDAEGLVIVPRQPTTEMFNAAWRESQVIVREAGGSIDKDQLIHVLERYYAAMIDAAVNWQSGQANEKD